MLFRLPLVPCSRVRDSPVSTWPTVVLFLNVILTSLLESDLLVTIIVSRVGHGFAASCCRAVGFGAIHRFPGGQVELSVDES